jgi:hypothetical protein
MNAGTVTTAFHESARYLKTGVEGFVGANLFERKNRYVRIN